MKVTQIWDNTRVCSVQRRVIVTVLLMASSVIEVNHDDYECDFQCGMRQTPSADRHQLQNQVSSAVWEQILKHTPKFSERETIYNLLQ